MRFLVDTNVLIALDPPHSSAVESATAAACRFHALALRLGHTIFIHPHSAADVARDTDTERRWFRQQRLPKYPVLPDAPTIQPRLIEALGSPLAFTNDWVDNHLLAALEANAIDLIVSEDLGIHSKARRLCLDDRVLTLSDAISAIEALSSITPQSLPAVEAISCHALDARDSIFDSLRLDYPVFDQWLARAQREHRQAWRVLGDAGGLSAFAIVKDEVDPLHELPGRVLKLCTFKVATHSIGFRLGELLLRSVFEYARINHFVSVYVTVFDKHEYLLELLKSFGFSSLEQRTAAGELILGKPCVPPDIKDPPDAVAYHMRYGPYYFTPHNVAWYLVPIRPQFSDLLFPDSTNQQELLPGRLPYGNAMRKAYLCNSAISLPSAGSVLVFYRSRRQQGAVALGILERAMRSDNASTVASAVAKRTVYSMSQIQMLVRAKPVLTLLFRHARTLSPRLGTNDLRLGGVFEKPPQSLMTLQPGAISWMIQRLAV